MSPPSRRTHTKSRLGCQQCKKNRTKCDEKRPSCTRCSKTGATCSLADPASALIVISDYRVQKTPSEKVIVSVPSSSTSETIPTPSPKSGRAEQEPESEEPPPTTATFTGDLSVSNHDIVRMKLVAHYCQSTWESISKLTLEGTDEGLALWQHYVPELAFKHDFLLDGMLSITALHKALSEPESAHEYRILAVQYHNHGIALFSPRLAQITEENVDALFAFACLTALYSFGIHLQSQSHLSPLVKIHEVYTLIRGTSLIVKSGMQWLRRGIWASWTRPRENVEHRLADEMENALAKLTSRVETTITTSSQSTAYYATIGALRQNYIQANARPRNQMSLVLFPIISPPEFLEMVCIGEPLALAILANWAVVLHRLRGHIWLQGWGKQTIEAVHEVLPPDWHDCISWALSELHSQGDSFNFYAMTE